MFFKFIALSIIYLFFYFNTQYWCGKAILDLSSSRLWQAIYKVLSSIGYILYKLSEWISYEIICFTISKVHFLHRKNQHPVLSKTINIIVYSMFIIGMVQIYDIINEFLIRGLGDTKVFNDSLIKVITGDEINIGEFVLNLSAYINVIYYILTQKEIISGIITIILLFLFNLIYYSSFYGFLSQKVYELNILSILNIENEELSITVDEEYYKNSSIILKLKESVKSFLTKRTWLYSLKDIRVLAIILIILFCITWISEKLGKEIYNGMDLLIIITDELGILTLIINCLITSIFSIITIKMGRNTYRICPSYVQNNIDSFTDRIYEYSNTMETRRREWAEENDTSINDEIIYEYNTTYRQRQNEDSRRYQREDYNHYEDHRYNNDYMNSFNHGSDRFRNYQESRKFISYLLRITDNNNIDIEDFCRFILDECSYIPSSLKQQAPSKNKVIGAAYCLEMFNKEYMNAYLNNLLNEICEQYKESRR